MTSSIMSTLSPNGRTSFLVDAPARFVPMPAACARRIKTCYTLLGCLDLPEGNIARGLEKELTMTHSA